MQKTVMYDRENDILAVHNGFSEGERFRGNIEIGDLVLDLSTKMRIRGIEIMNTTRYLREFIRLPGSRRNILEDMDDIRFSAVIKGDSIAITLIIIAKEREIPAKIAVPVSEGSFR